nr:hypothetical protein Iba_chr14fCG12460 [Ipomoea batatas]
MLPLKLNHHFLIDEKLTRLASFSELKNNREICQPVIETLPSFAIDTWSQGFRNSVCARLDKGKAVEFLLESLGAKYQVIQISDCFSTLETMQVGCRRRSPVRCGADVCEMGDLRLGSASCMPLFGDGERRHTEMAAAGDGDDKKKLTYLVATAQSSTPHLSSFGFGRALEL